MADWKRSSRPTGFSNGIWAAKLGLFVAGVVSVVGAGMVVMPYFVTFLATVLPRFWAPPYLFVVIHLIILVIWKLSDHKHHNHDQMHYVPIPEEKPKDPVMQHPPVPILRKQTPEFWREISPVSGEIRAGSGGGEPDPGGPLKSEESCVTAEPDVASTAESRSDAEKSVITAAEGVVDAESMEATWKAIMEKSSRPLKAMAAAAAVEVRAPPPTPARARRKEESVDAEEMNRRFEDFIKKNHEDIRLRKQESNRRRLEAINRPVY